MLFGRKLPEIRKKQDDGEEPREEIKLEKHDRLALLLSAYMVFFPIALAAIGVILLVALLLFRI